MDSINSFLRSLGNRVVLPPALEGKTFTIKAYPLCTARYEGDGTSVLVVQGRSPELIVPPGVDAGTLRRALLLIPGLPENLRWQLESIEDWRHTLPVPAFGGEAQEVVIAGCPGVFWRAVPPERSCSSLPGEEDPHFRPSFLVWDQDGVLYMIQGHLTFTEARDLARSMMQAR